MSNVSTNMEGSLNPYYVQKLNDMQDVNEAERKRTRESNQKQLDQLERRYEDLLHQRDEATSHEIRSVQEAAARSLQAEQDKYGQSVERLRNETYNRRGQSDVPVSPSELAAQKNRVEDLGQQLLSERRSHDQEEKRLENRLLAHEDSAQKKWESDTETTLQRMREMNQESAQRNQEFFREDLKKADLARTQVQEAASQQERQNQKSIQHLVEQNDVGLKALRERQAQNLQATAHQYADNKLDAEKKAATAIENANERANEALRAKNVYHQAELDQLKAKQSQPVLDETQLLKRQAKEQAEGERTNIAHERQAHEGALQRLAEGRLAENNTTAENTNRKLREMSQSQNEVLHNKENQFRAAQDQLQQASRRTVQDADRLMDQSKHTLAQEKKNFEADFIKEKSQSAEVNLDHQRELIEASNRAKEDQAIFFSKAIQDQGNDHHFHETALNEAYDRNLKHEKVQAEQILAQNEKQKTALLDRSHLDSQKTLQSQAEGFAKERASDRKLSEAQLTALKHRAELEHGPEALAVIDPKTVDAIRKPVIDSYQKQLEAEQVRKKQVNDVLEKKFVDQYQKVLADFSEKETRTYQKNSLDQAMDRSRFSDAVQEIEQQAKSHIYAQNSEHERSNEEAFRRFDRTLNQQRKSYEQLFNHAEDVFSNRLLEVRQTLESEVKDQYRSSVAKQNELIHEYERHLADQKNQFEVQIEDLKGQMKEAGQLADRRLKSELEAQQKSFDARIAQNQAQTKERERLLAQGYQDELDKVKRNYEVLAKKRNS